MQAITRCESYPANLFAGKTSVNGSGEEFVIFFTMSLECLQNDSNMGIDREMGRLGKGLEIGKIPVATSKRLPAGAFIVKSPP